MNLFAKSRAFNLAKQALNSPRGSLITRTLLFLAIFASGVLIVGAAVSYAHPHPNSISGLTSEKGKFRILVNGQEVGKEEFEIGERGGDWTVHGVSDIQSADGKTKVTGTLELHSDGTPLSYQWSIDGAKKAAANISFSGSIATIDLHVDGARPFTQQFTFTSPQVVVLDNNLYEQYIVLSRLYDWRKGGTQTFSVLVPQENTPGSVTVESLGEQDLDGKKLDELQVKTEDIELDLYLDGNRLTRISVPSSGAEIIRE